VSTSHKKLLLVETNKQDIMLKISDESYNVFSEDEQHIEVNHEVRGTVYLEDVIFCPKIYYFNNMIIYQNCDFVLKFFDIKKVIKSFDTKFHSKIVYSSRPKTETLLKKQKIKAISKSQMLSPDKTFQCHSFLQDVSINLTSVNSKKMPFRKFVRQVKGKANLKSYDNLVNQQGRFLVFDDVYLYRLDLNVKLLQTTKFEYFDARFVSNFNVFDGCGKVYIHNLQDNYLYVYKLIDFTCLLRIQIDMNIEEAFFINIHTSKGIFVTLNDQNWLSTNIVSAREREDLFKIIENNSKEINAFSETKKNQNMNFTSNKENIMKQSNEESKYTTEYLNKKIRGCKQMKISKGGSMPKTISKKNLKAEGFGSFFKVNSSVKKGSLGIMILHVSVDCLDEDLLSPDFEDFELKFGYDCSQAGLDFQTPPFSITKESFNKESNKDNESWNTMIKSKNKSEKTCSQYLYFKIKNYLCLEFQLICEFSCFSKTFRTSESIMIPPEMFLDHVQFKTQSMEYFKPTKLTKVILSGNLDFSYLENTLKLNAKNYLGQIENQKQYIFLKNPRTNKISPIIYYIQEKCLMIDMDDPELTNLFLTFITKNQKLQGKITQKFLFQEIMDISSKIEENETQINDSIDTLQKAQKDLANLNSMFNQQIQNIKETENLEDIQFLITRYIEFTFHVFQELSELIKTKIWSISVINFYLKEIGKWSSDPVKFKEMFDEVLRLDVPSCGDELISNPNSCLIDLYQKIYVFSKTCKFKCLGDFEFENDQVKDFKVYAKYKNVNVSLLKDSLQLLFKKI
jgi:hypothetical protein